MGCCASKDLDSSRAMERRVSTSLVKLGDISAQVEDQPSLPSHKLSPATTTVRSPSGERSPGSPMSPPSSELETRKESASEDVRKHRAQFGETDFFAGLIAQAKMEDEEQKAEEDKFIAALTDFQGPPVEDNDACVKAEKGLSVSQTTEVISVSTSEELHALRRMSMDSPRNDEICAELRALSKSYDAGEHVHKRQSIQRISVSSVSLLRPSMRSR